jgi:glutaredoxin
MMAVTVYTRHDCPFSAALKEALEREGRKFTEIDVARSPRTIPELMKLTGGKRIVPVVIDESGVHVAPAGGTAF